MPDTDSGEFAEIVLERRNTQEWVLRYSLAFSLYQQLMLDLRRYSLKGELPKQESRRRAVLMVKEVHVPLGPFNFLEFAIGRTRQFSDLGGMLQAQAGRLASTLDEAIHLIHDDYREREWPKQKTVLQSAAERLTDLVDKNKDDMVGMLAERLAQTVPRKPLEIQLVPHAYVPSGAYSHPTVVDISRFRELDLVEVILHELAHVLLDESRHQNDTLSSCVFASCARAGKNERYALELLHLLVFHASGAIVQEVYAPDYEPYAKKKRIYQRIGRSLGSEFDPDDLEGTWQRWTRKELGLRETIDKLMELLKSG